MPFPLSRVRLAHLALGCVLAAGLAWSAAGKPESPAPPALTPPPKPGPARNPVTLQLQADERQLLGWVSGPRDFAGQRVHILVEGVRAETLRVGKGNTFAWPYKVGKPTLAQVVVDDPSSATSPRARILLTPRADLPGPCVFFVVDRTAYRPGQPLHFAGFLRKEDADGELIPIPGQNVEVELTSQRKGTRAAKMKLTSDEFGRITGSYTFSDGDPLDSYNLAIPGYKGSANVMLGEYRKSKVRLKINGALDGEKMKLTFEALDFLDKPVRVAKGSFVAQVVRRGKEKAFTLKGEDFVYHQASPFLPAGLDSLAEEDLLLHEAEGVAAATFPGLGDVLTQVTGELKPEGEKAGVYSFEVKKEWLDGACAVVVNGVVLDDNGREQRGSTNVPLEAKKGKDGKKALELSTPRKRYGAGEAVEVRAAGTAFAARDPEQPATLVVMKLAFQTPSTALAGYGLYATPQAGLLPAWRSSRLRVWNSMDAGLASAGPAQTVRRTLVTAVPFKGDTACVKLSEPGAYKLIALVPSKEGASLQQETTVVVKRPADIRALEMRLDREEYVAGGRLTGVVVSRFTDARALLTLRDSTGIRLSRPIEFKDGLCKLDEPLPAGLRYGCSVDVLYPEDAEHSHSAHAFVRVVPRDRMLTVSVTPPKDPQPGQKVRLGLQVNRKERVDLIVSVYDQALLGIAPDKSVDVRNFFLADERAEARHHQALLQRRVGGVRLAALFDRAAQLLKEAEARPAVKKLGPAEQLALRNLLERRTSRCLYATDAVTLLRLAGVDVYFAPYAWGTNWYRQFKPDTDERLLDLLQSKPNEWQLVPHFVGGTLVLHETYPGYLTSGAWHPIYGGRHGFGYGWGFNPYLNSGLGFNYFGNTLSLNQADGLWLGGLGYTPARGHGALAFSPDGAYLASGNSAFSFMPEGQAFLSHLPAAGAPVPLLDAGPDQPGLSIRRDFSDSAFWNASVRTDKEGKAAVEFKLPDSLTNWQVVVTAVTPKLHVGSGKGSFRTHKPVMVWPMLPRTFTEGDKIQVFASVHNRTPEPQDIKVRLKVENGEVLTPAEKTVTVGPSSNVPVYWTFRPGAAGYTQLLMTVSSPAGSDASLKRLPVVRAAAEQVVTASGTVKESAIFEVPEGVDPTSSRLEITLAPSLAADMADTLNYLVDYPYGCVEQTMSRFLPAIKVAQILQRYKVQHPELQKKLPRCVAGGIKRLLELQQGDGGWGWNGNGGTHEMMTPYALYGLLQAEKAGYAIPNERAVNLGLDRLGVFIANMGDGQAVDRIYCMYVFSHRRDLAPQVWDWLAAHVRKKTLSDYALALALEMAVEKGKKELAKEAAEQLRARAQKVGGRVFWKSAGFSRWGDDPFEVTAAVMKALVAYDKDDPLIDGVLAFFAATKRGDRWNSTKDTALILFAMCDYLARVEQNAQVSKTLSVTVNGVARHVTFEDGLAKKVTIPGNALKRGKNTLVFKTAMTGVLYRAVLRYWKEGREIPAMDAGLSVKRTFALLNDKGEVVRELKSGDSVCRGSYIRSRVEAHSPLPGGLRYVVVEDPRLSGSEVLPEDDPRFRGVRAEDSAYVLREDREVHTAFHLEQTSQVVRVSSVVLAELAGELMAPPAKVELMYQTETRGHSGSFVLEVTEKPAK